MKKVFAICLALVMVMSMSLTVFAAPGSFVSSPSGNPAPELVKATPESDECEASIVITSYADRDTLPDDVREMLEKAYEEIVAASDLTSLSAALAALAEEMGVSGTDLSISDLFDLRYVESKGHDGHGYFDIVIKSETFNKFFALLRYNNGVWELIKDAKVDTVSGEFHLSFSADDFAPLAIVVNTADGINGAENTDPFQTGNNSNFVIYVIIMAGSALAMIVIWRKSKKQSV